MQTIAQTLVNIYLYSPWLDPKVEVKKDTILDFFPESRQPKRLIFRELIQGVSSKFIVALLGLRRLGKTTLAKQFLAYRLQSDFEVYSQSLYYQFNEQDNNLEQVLSVYFSQVILGPVQNITTVIVLDEIQYCQDWQVTLKKYYDLNQNIEFIITGSTSVYIHEQTRESLSGRMLDVLVEPITFWEYIYLKNKLRFDDFASLQLKPEDFYDKQYLLDKLRKRQRYIAGLQSQFYQYLVAGEYPRTIFNKVAVDSQTYLETQVLEKILRKDVRLFDIKNEQAIELLFATISQDTSSILNIRNISSDLGISVNTLKKYLLILKKMFLVYQAQNYHQSLRKRKDSQKKFFASSLSLAIAATHTKQLVSSPIQSSFKGKLVETYVHNRFRSTFPNQTFFKKRKNMELDLWIQLRQDQALPIEVKSKKHFRSSDVRHLLKNVGSKDCPWGIITSFVDEITYDEATKLLSVPVWLW